MRRRKNGILQIVANVIWLIFGGFWLALLWAVLGGLLCITVVGIPFGVQCFKAMKLSFFPFGKQVTIHIERHPVANVLWAVLGGWEMAIAYLICGALNCLTIIGIGRGIQCFKIMKLAFFPFGATVR